MARPKENTERMQIRLDPESVRMLRQIVGKRMVEGKVADRSGVVRELIREEAKRLGLSQE